MEKEKRRKKGVKEDQNASRGEPKFPRHKEECQLQEENKIHNRS